MKKFFKVKTSWDNAKRYVREMKISDNDWNYMFDSAEFEIKDNYKELERSLKSFFGKVELSK